MDAQNRLKCKSASKRKSLSCKKVTENRDIETCFKTISSTTTNLKGTLQEAIEVLNFVFDSCKKKDTLTLVTLYNKLCGCIRDITLECKLSQTSMLGCKDTVHSLPIKITDDTDEEDMSLPWEINVKVEENTTNCCPEEQPKEAVKNEALEFMAWDELDFNFDSESSIEKIAISEQTSEAPQEKHNMSPQNSRASEEQMRPEQEVKQEFEATSQQGRAQEEPNTDPSQDISLNAAPQQDTARPEANTTPQQDTPRPEANSTSQQDVASEEIPSQQALEIKMEHDYADYESCISQDTNVVLGRSIKDCSCSDLDIGENVIRFNDENEKECTNHSCIEVKEEKECKNPRFKPKSNEDSGKTDDNASVKFPSPEFIKDSLDDFDISNSNLHHLAKEKEEDSKNCSSDRSFQINLSQDYVQERLGVLSKKKFDKKPSSDRLNQSKCILSASTTEVSDKSDTEVDPRGTSERSLSSSNAEKGKNQLCSNDLTNRKDSKLTFDEIVQNYLCSLPEDRSPPNTQDSEITDLEKSACTSEMIDNKTNDKTDTDDDYVSKKSSNNDIDTSKDSNRPNEDPTVADTSNQKRNDENKDKESDLPIIDASPNVDEATPSDKETRLPSVEDSQATIPNPPKVDADIEDSSDNENLLVPLVPQTPEVEDDVPEKDENLSVSVIQETPCEEENASDNENLLIPLLPVNPENASEDETVLEGETTNDVETSDNEDLLVPIIEEIPVKENHAVLESKGEQDLPDPLDVVLHCSDNDDTSSQGDLLIPLVNGVDSSSDENRDETNKDLALLSKIQYTSNSDVSIVFSSSDSDLESRASLRRKRKKNKEVSSTMTNEEIAEECVKRKCLVLMVKNKIYDVDPKQLKVKSEIRRLFNLSSLNKRRRSNTSSTSDSSIKINRNRTKKSKPLNDSSDSDSEADALSSSSSTIPYNDHLEFEAIKKCSTEDMNENDLFNNIRDSDDSSIKEDDDDDEDDEEDEVVKNNEKANESEDKTKKDKVKSENKEVSAWRKDPLLTLRFSSDSEMDESEKEKKQKKDEARLQETSDTVLKEENYFSIDSFDDENCTEDDSDCEFISYTKNKRKRRSKSSGDSDDVQINEENDDVMVVEDGSPKKGGRRNIRALMSAHDLEKSTKLAAIQEKEHTQRLEEKRKRMDEVLTQSGLSQDSGLFLDAFEDSIIEVNPNLGRRLKAHQVKGVQFMWDACYESVKTMQAHSGSGCILAHCMGLGKTFQVITLIHTLFKHPITNTKHVLVVCPLSIVKNWKNEFNIAKEHAKDDTRIDVRIISGDNKELRTRIQVVTQWKASGGVLVMGYETFICLTKEPKEKQTAIRDAVFEALVDPGPDLIVCDEGHQLKNNKTMRTKALMRIKTKRRIILTGTPLQNNLSEYYHMVQFVKPNLLGTYSEYTNRFVNPISNGQYDDSTLQDIFLMKKRSHVLHSILTNTMQRYEVSELERYLPNKLDFVLFVPLHSIQAALYKHCIGIFRSNQERNKLFTHFNILQAIWTHPAILHYKDQLNALKKQKPNENQDEELSSGWWKNLVPEDCLTNASYGPKFKIMLTIIKECEKVGDKLLIFSSYIAELNAIEEFLKNEKNLTKGANYLRMDGNVAPDQRQEYCNQFNNKRSKIGIFLLTHRVGGLGLNLAAANRVILMDICWNPSFDNQSIFRAYRFGQDKMCYVYRLVSMGTMEEVVYERSVTKQAIAGRVVDEMQITRHYKSHEVSSMYRCNVDINEERPCPKLPEDNILAGLLQEHKEDIFKYHEHETLLRNLPDEELDEEQAKIAWDEYNKEKEALDNAANSVYNPVGLQSFVPRPILNDINNIPGTSSTYFNYNNMRQQDHPVIFSVGSKTVTAAVDNVAITSKTNPRVIQDTTALIQQLSPQINALNTQQLTANGTRLPRLNILKKPIGRSNLPKRWVVGSPGSPRGKPTSQVAPLRLERVIDVDQLDLLKKIDKNTDVTLTTVIDDAEEASTSGPPPSKKDDIIEID